MSTKKILKRKRDFDGRFVKFFKKCIRNSLHLPYAFCNQLENRTAMTTLFFLLPQFNSFSLIIWFLLITISLYIINLHKYTSCQYEHWSMGSDVFGEQKSGSDWVRGSIFRGRPPQVFRVSGIFKVKFRIGWCQGWFGVCFSGLGWVQGSNF